jgi:RHS repeat-associated protein
VVNAVGTASVALWNVSVDHLNRPVLMTNSLKGPVWTAVWQPWGGAHSITGTGVLDARFPGRWHQTETGLHYNWHRSYDPAVGRYTQPDPLGFVDGPSVYGYAKGQPQTLIDKDGRLVIPAPPPIMIVIGVCVGVKLRYDYMTTSTPPISDYCQKAQQKCHEKCSKLRAYTSSDSPSLYRKCMRECMAPSGFDGNY